MHDALNGLIIQPKTVQPGDRMDEWEQAMIPRERTISNSSNGKQEKRAC
jgi:hypothetical protein